MSDEKETCALCDKPLVADGDNWDELCPSCADEVSEYLDDNKLTNDDKDEVIARLKAQRQEAWTGSYTRQSSHAWIITAKPA